MIDMNVTDPCHQVYFTVWPDSPSMPFINEYEIWQKGVDQLDIRNGMVIQDLYLSYSELPYFLKLIVTSDCSTLAAQTKVSNV